MDVGDDELVAMIGYPRRELCLFTEFLNASEHVVVEVQPHGCSMTGGATKGVSSPSRASFDNR